VLLQLADDIRDCYERAAETSEKAVRALDRDLKAEYLDMERR